MKKINYIFFIYPFVISLLNIQVIIALFYSANFAQLVAYSNVLLIIIGIIHNYKNIGTISKTASLWIGFYVVYYFMGLIASVLQENYLPFIRTFVPVIYFFGFLVFLSNKKHLAVFFNVTTYFLFLTCVILIVMDFLDFDIDKGGVDIFNQRAQGITGDSNNSAFLSILSFIFWMIYFKTKSSKNIIFKFVVLSITIYSLILTFSTTGFVVFIGVLVLINLKFFTPQRIVFLVPVLIGAYLALINLSDLTSSLELRPLQQLKIDNIQNIARFDFENVDDSGRDSLLKGLMEYIYKSPILGNGVDFYTKMHSHNTLLGVWADSGIFGFLAFIFVLITYAYYSFKLPIFQRATALSILIAFVIFMLSLQTMINQPHLLAILVFLGYYIDNNYVKNHNNEVKT